MKLATLDPMDSSTLKELGHNLIDSATEGIVVTGTKGIIVYANSAAHSMFKYAEGELAGLPVDKLVPMGSRGNHEGYRNSYNKKPEKKSMGRGRDLKGLTKDGNEFCVEISLTPLQLDGERHVAALITDISERKKLEDKVHRLNESLEERVKEKIKEVKRTQKLYDAVARNYPNGTISVLDENLNYLMVEGKQLYEMDITSEALYGSPYLDQIPELVRDQVEARLKKVLAGENQNFELSHGDNVYRIDAVSIEMQEESARNILIVEQNITELSKALEKERELSELKSRFVSMASHEFRTPLSTIFSSSDLISQYQTRGDLDKSAKHLDRIKDSVKHLVTILDDYLSLEKFEEGSWSDDFERIDIAACLAGIVDEQKAIIKPAQKINFVPQVAEGEKTLCINVAVKGIAMNLIANASKYSEDGTTIDVIFSECDDNWVLKVVDRGVGISKDEIDNIFDQFYRSDNTSHIPGTGVGLDLVQRYLKALGGSISVESEMGEGSVFTAVWPKVKQENK